MGWDADSKLDVAGLALAAIVVLSVGLAIFGAVQAASSPDPEGPDAEWSVDRVNQTHVEIAYVEGDTLHVEDVALRIDGNVRAPPFRGTIEPGDDGTAYAYSGAEIRLYWTATEGDWIPLYEGRV